MGILDDIKGSFRKGNNLYRLIYFNIALFIIITIIGVLGILLVRPEMINQTIRFLSVPSSLHTLMLRPWTIITYMFTHQELLQLSDQKYNFICYQTDCHHYYLNLFSISSSVIILITGLPEGE